MGIDTNKWRPSTQGSEGVPDGGDWRVHIQPEARARIINKIMDRLKRHNRYSQIVMNELRKIVSRFEEKVYTSATSEYDYLRKIAVKILTIEKSNANPGGNRSRPKA